MEFDRLYIYTIELVENFTVQNSDHVPHSENGVDLIELIAFKTQLFSHARNVGIVEICAIEVTFVYCQYISKVL